MNQFISKKMHHIFSDYITCLKFSRQTKTEPPHLHSLDLYKWALLLGLFLGETRLMLSIKFHLNIQNPQYADWDSTTHSNRPRNRNPKYCFKVFWTHSVLKYSQQKRKLKQWQVIKQWYNYPMSYLLSSMYPCSKISITVEGDTAECWEQGVLGS